MNGAKVTILIVDDDEKILYAFEKVFDAEGYRTLRATDGEQALAIAARDHPSLVFMDITMPRLDGLEALRRMKELNPLLPVVLITGLGSMQTAIKAIQLGAFDYLTKPLDVPKVRSVVRKALSSLAATEGSVMTERGYQAEVVDRYELIGNSRQMQEIYKLIGSISTTPNHTSVLVLGESGTGKELVARAIHANGANREEPFIPINCTVLPETLLESELFGHEKGAFTGAGERKLGKFELARNGTIFLDEIGNLTPNLQQKLLRVLQEREFERLGGNAPLTVEARFIAATNRDLVADVKNKLFREDLYYRLNVVTITLPPLRERREDIALLARYFTSKYNERLKKSVKGLSKEAMLSLEKYSFPGNVRELENLIERAIMLTHGETILPDAVLDVADAAAPGAPVLPIISDVFSEARSHVIEAFEKQFVQLVLNRHRGNVSSAAKASGMTRQNFQRLMTKHGIDGSTFRA